jgi:hypothetical protein
MWLAAGVAALGAVLAFWLISPKRAPEPDSAHGLETTAEAAVPS